MVTYGYSSCYDRCLNTFKCSCPAWKYTHACLCVCVYSMRLLLCGRMPVCVYFSGKGSAPFRKQTQMAIEKSQYAYAVTKGERRTEPPTVKENARIFTVMLSKEIMRIIEIRTQTNMKC